MEVIMFQQLLFISACIICLLGISGMLNNMLKLEQDAFVLSGAVVLLMCASFSNVLAVFGVFNAIYVLLFLLLVGIVMLIKFKRSIPTLMVKKESVIIILIFFISIGTYVSYKIIPFGTGRDPSVYFMEGIHIARTGGISFSGDSFIADNYESLKYIIDTSYSGLYSAYDYGISNTPGDIVAQFLHIFPCLLAFGYSLFGINGLLAINPIIASLSMGIVYIYVKHLFGKKSAYIAAAFCAFNPAQIYCARITQSEMLGQLIFLLSIYLFSLGWSKRSNGVMAFSGALVGFATFNRIDMYILGIGVYILTLYHIWMRPVNKKMVCVYCAGYSIVGTLALIYGIIFSYPYYKDHWDMGVLFYILLCNAILGILVIISNIARRRWLKNRECDIFELISKNTRLLNLCFIFLLIVILYAYYLRPIYAIASGGLSESQRFNSNALRELCFYISILAVFLGVYGLYHLMKNYMAERWEQLLPLIFMGMSNLLIYVYQPSIASDHIWASRRWITICIPFILILAGYGVSCVSYKSFGKYFQVISAMIVLCYMLLQGRGFLQENIGGYILEEYKIFSDKLQNDKLYFCQNKWTVTVLREIFDKKNVLRLKNDYVSYLPEYLEDKNEIYIIGSLPESIKSDEQFYYRKVLDSYIYSNELEHSYGKMPVDIQPVVVDTQIFYVSDLENKDKLDIMDVDIDNSVPYVYDIQKFSSITGTVTKNGIIAGENEGYSLYGPYVTLEKGTYYADINFDIPTNPIDDIGYFEVTKNHGEVINSLTVNLSSCKKTGNMYTVSLPFSLKEKTENIEYRFYTYSNTKVKINEVSLMQVSNIFVVGLDDTNGMKQLLKSREPSAGTTISYLKAVDDEKISLEYLSQLESSNIKNLYWGNRYANKQDYLIATMDNDEWMKTLYSYNVIDRSGNYLLLQNKNYQKNMLAKDPSYEAGYTDLGVFCREKDQAYIAGEYSEIYPGSYSLKIGFDSNVDSDIFVNLYSGNSLLESEVQTSENELSVRFYTFKSIENFLVNVYDKNGRHCIPEYIAIRQNENLEKLEQRINVEPHYKIIETIMSELGEGDTIVIEENDEINESTQKYDYIICPKSINIVFDLLQKKYIVINKTNTHILMIKEDILTSDMIDKNKLTLLSRNGYLMYDYFYDTNKAISKISIPKGTYEFVIKVVGNGALKDCKLAISDGETLLKEEDTTFDFSKTQEYLIPIIISKEWDMKDIKVELKSKNFDYIQFCGITQIRKISENYIVNLNDMICTSGEHKEDEIYLNTYVDSEIYGPYIELQDGEYCVFIEYQSSNDADISFYVTANDGRQVLSQGVDPENKTDGKLHTMMIPFTVTNELKRIEFYIHVPANTEFCLKEIAISNESVNKSMVNIR